MTIRRDKEHRIRPCSHRHHQQREHSYLSLDKNTKGNHDSNGGGKGRSKRHLGAGKSCTRWGGLFGGGRDGWHYGHIRVRSIGRGHRGRIGRNYRGISRRCRGEESRRCRGGALLAVVALSLSAAGADGNVVRVLVRTVTRLGIGTRVNEVIKALAATLNNNLATSAGTGLCLLSSRRHGRFRSRGGCGDFLASLSVETLALLTDTQLSFLAFLVVAVARARPTSIRESSCTLTAAVSDNDATRLGALGLTLRRRKWRWLERWRDCRTGGGGGGARLGSHLTRRDAMRAIVAKVLGAFAYRNLVREIFVASTDTKGAGVGLERKESRELNQQIQ